MQIMHMNWKTGKMEPCVEHRLERGQVVMGIDGPSHEYDGVVLERVENGKWGTSCRILWIDDLRVSRHQFIKPITERFGIGVYFYPGRLMPEEKIAELEKRFLEKERAEAIEAEKRRIENERLAVIGKEHFADAIKKHGKPVALILAVEHEDVSDLQTDYFDYRTVRTVVLAFSKHKRNLFPAIFRKSGSWRRLQPTGRIVRTIPVDTVTVLRKANTAAGPLKKFRFIMMNSWNVSTAMRGSREASV